MQKYIPRETVSVQPVEAALQNNLAAARAPSTRRAYASALARFREKYQIPATPREVALHLSEIGLTSTPATVRVHAAAIGAAHTDIGIESPVKHVGVIRTLQGLANRNAGRPAAQATPIDAEIFDKIIETAQIPRIGRGGKLETSSMALDRGLMDMGLIGLMRDAMLRRSEAAALVWGDLSLEADGTGRLTIRKSKTDQEGHGSVHFVSEGVATVLQALSVMGFAQPEKSIFGMSDSQICRRIASACKAAGCTGNFSGHSPRIGMAVDLARAGLGLVEMMQAGRWKSPDMPAYYTRNITAGAGAVAKWYGRET